jgi:glycosyltransferase involved in cell wall biosynthesis
LFLDLKESTKIKKLAEREPFWETEMRNLNFIIYLSGEWKGFHRQQMILAFANELGNKGKILCINRPVCPFVTPIKHPQKLISWIFNQHLEKISDNLFVYTPFIILHDLLAPKLIGAVTVNRFLLKWQISTVLNRINFPKNGRVSWMYCTNHVYYLGLVEEEYSVYECYDESHYDADGKFNPRRQREEKKLLSKTNMVLTTAKSLYQTRKKFNPLIYYLPNGVNYEVFSQAVNDYLQIPKVLKIIPPPRIGYVGSISTFLDFDLLEELAKARTDWAFVMIGPVDGKAPIRKLRDLPNIHFLGKVNHLDLPSYLKGLDVLIVPFALNPYTICTNPLTVHEHIAAGRPVVSVSLPELEKFKPVIELVPPQVKPFISAIEYWLANKNSPRIKLGCRMIQEYSWQKISKRILDIFETSFK